MTERENLPAKLAEQGLAATTEKRGSLVARGMAAVLINAQELVTKDNDAIYRHAREVYNRLTDDGLGAWFGYVEREQPLIEALNTFLQLASEGYGKAYFPLSTLYGGEQSVKGDTAQAEHFHRLAFDWLLANQYLNDPEIWHDLGVLHGFDDEIEVAINWFQKAAEAGLVSSMWALTGVYEDREDWETSLYWQIMAAEAGHDEAQRGLEMQHEHGNLEEKIDDEQVFNWYVWSAEQGHLWAQLFLAEAFRCGDLIEQDDERAAHWFGNLGISYRYGDDGTQTDDDKARKYLLLAATLYREAAESGEGWGQFGLGLCYGTGHGVEHDDGQAVYWLRKAAVQGDGSGQYALGDMYKSGRGVAQDDEQAVYWFRKSAEQGNELGQLKLGISYKTGRGVLQDKEQAMYWISKAAEQGNPLAKAGLKNLGIDWKK